MKKITGAKQIKLALKVAPQLIGGFTIEIGSKLIDTSKVENIFTNSFKYAYVIYDKGHRRNTDTVLNYLRSINIEPLGRFGTFEYINSDKAIELAKELAMESKE